MYTEPVGPALRQLCILWTASYERLARRLDGLTEEEFGWAPVPDCWALRPDPEAPSGWQIDYAHPVPTPPPFTTIAWRLVHIASGNWIRWEHALGPARRTFLDLYVPSTVDGALAYWRDSAAPIAAWLATATEPDLDRPGRTLYGEVVTAGETVRILLDEQVHHGAEIGVLRDLYAHSHG